MNPSQRIAASGAEVISSIEAVRNLRALGLVFAALGVAAAAVGLGLALARASFIFPLLFTLLGWAIAFYGVNAAGIVLMDEAKGVRTGAREALLRSLASSHRLLLLMLLVAAVYLAGMLVLALVFLVCKIPFVGPLLYAVVFPPSVLLCGVAFLALFLVVMPLGAPAVWDGASTTQAASRLFAIARQKLTQVLLLMLLLSLVCVVIGGLLVGVLFNGTLITASLSAPILGAGELLAAGMNPMALMGGRTGSYALAAGIGGGVLYAVVLSLPALIYVRGCCAVYLANIADVDVEGAEGQLREQVARARAKADAFKEQQLAARARAERQQAEVTAAEARAQAQAHAHENVAAEAAAPVGAARDEDLSAMTVLRPAPLRCTGCATPHLVSDKFCGSCGTRLGVAA